MAFREDTKKTYQRLVICGVTDNEILFDFTMPGNKKREQLENKSLQIRGSRVKTRTTQMFFQCGKDCAIGIRDGDLEQKNKNQIEVDGNVPEWVPVSSDKSSPFFRGDWKAIIEKECPHMFTELGKFIMNATATEEPEDQDEEDDDESGTVFTEKNSVTPSEDI